jgi:predicted Holliday junction resolvase-like endonuclease
MASELIIGLVIGLAIGIVVVYVIMKSRIKNEFAKLDAEHELDVEKRVEEATKISNNQQRASVKGKITEQLAPLLPEFAEKYETADARFIGTPIDYIIFKNMSKFDPKSEQNIPIEIEFVEVKTGKNKKLTDLEEAVQTACIVKGIPFEVLNPKIE